MSEEKKLSAVEWLETELKKSIHFYRLIADLKSKSTIFKDDVFQKAKEMEKQQVINAFGVVCQVESNRLIGYQDLAEQYYNENFGVK